MMTNGNRENTFYFYRGRTALYILLQALNLQPGDEVLLQAFTCLAVPSPIVTIGARPVFLDIDPRSFNIDPQKLEGHITPRAKVLIVQHTFGNPAEMDSIMAVARKHGLAVIEDCCHVLGTKYKGNEVGSFGEAAFYSYEWGKPVVIGVGGAAVVHAGDLRARVRELSKTLIAPSLKKRILIHAQYLAFRLLVRPSIFWNVRDAYRFLSRKGLVVASFSQEDFQGKFNLDYQTRMATSLQRRLESKLRDAGKETAARRSLAEKYLDGLLRIGLESPKEPAGAETVYLRYPIRVKNKAEVLEQARKSRVVLGDWFATPIHPLKEEQWKFVGYERGRCPEAEEACRHVVTLPLFGPTRPSDINNTMAFLSRMREKGYL